MPEHRPELGPCLQWTGGKFPFGHGSFWFRGRNLKASRVAFFLAHGRWPDPCCLHHCDNPSCVRPEHLFEGTLFDNMRDCAAKGRIRGGSPIGTKHPNAKLNEHKVRALRTDYARGVCKAALARKYGIGETAVSQVVSRRTWRHVA